MSTLTKLALGMMGRLRPKPATGDSTGSIPLPPPDRRGGISLMESLAQRRSSRDFAPEALPLPLLSGLLWAAYGVNRPDGGRTAPSALNAQEI
ncbi:MAG TPA: nitroreductase family protein, partial [Burkholderiales bacterium]